MKLKNKIKINQFIIFPDKDISLSYFLFLIFFLCIHNFFQGSVITLHFLLNHELSSISDWSFRNAWELTIISKIIAFYLWLRIFKNLIPIDWKLKSIIVQSLGESFNLKQLKYFIVILLFFYSMFFVFTNPLFKMGFSAYEIILNLLKNIWIYFGTILFYTFDLIILMLLSFIYFDINKYSIFFRSKEKINLIKSNYYKNSFNAQFFNFESYKNIKKFITIIFLCSLNYFLAPLLYPYAVSIDIYLFFHFLMIMSLLFLDFIPNIFTFLYLIFIIGPLSLFFGINPLWGNIFSFFELRTPINFIDLLIIYSIMMIYFIVKTFEKNGGAK